MSYTEQTSKVRKKEAHLNGNKNTRTEDISFEIVANLLERQDQVLDELDQLNHKIESMIKSLTGKNTLFDGDRPEDILAVNSTDRSEPKKSKAA